MSVPLIPSFSQTFTIACGTVGCPFIDDNFLKFIQFPYLNSLHHLFLFWVQRAFRTLQGEEDRCPVRDDFVRRLVIILNRMQRPEKRVRKEIDNNEAKKNERERL
jgi:hypothetical protein